MSEQLNDGDGQTNQTPDPGTAPEEKEKVTFTEEQQAVIDKVGHQGRENVRTERAKNADLQRQLDEVTARIPKETRPTVPDAGDVYDENYETQQQSREKQIKEQAKFDARQEWDTEQVQTAQLAEQQKQQTAYNDSLANFNNSAAKFDINASEVQTMDAIVTNYGSLRADVGNRILSDDQGMLIYKYLSENPEDILKVNQMTEGNAAIFVNEVKAKATALYTKRPSNAPDPAENLSGSGVPPGKRGAKGATYE